MPQMFIPVDPDNTFIVGPRDESAPEEVWEQQQEDLEGLADSIDELDYGGFPYWKDKDDAFCAARLVVEAYPGTSVFVSQTMDGGWICD
jgi:hypothetical protein